MKLSIKTLMFLIAFSLSFSFVYGLALSGENLKISFDFSPNYSRQDNFYVTNREGYISNYKIFPTTIKGADISKYFTIEPDRIDNIDTGGTGSFIVKLNLPESLDVPGEGETWVKVEIDNTQEGGGLRAYPSVAARYLFFVLYPYKFVKWSFNAPNMNINEPNGFQVRIENLGEPTIGRAYADITVTSLETNTTIKEIRTNEESIVARQSKTLFGEFSTFNVMPGDYKANVTLYWDNNISTDEKYFRVGSKYVRIINFTNLFEVNAINKFEIRTASEWNTKISDIYANVEVFDIDTKDKLAEFKSLNSELFPWEVKTMLAYFDTKGFEKKEYLAKIALYYDRETTREEGKIQIGENINSDILSEIPGTFNLMRYVTLSNTIVLLLIIFLIANIILFTTFLKMRRTKAGEDDISEDVINHIKELKAKYNDEYIKAMMIKKGWSLERIKKALKKIK